LTHFYLLSIYYTALYLDTDVSGGPAASSSRGNEGTCSSQTAVPSHEIARCSNRDDHNMKNNGGQISGAWSSGRLNFVRWRLMFVGPLSVVLELLHAAGAYNFEVASIFLENLRALAENRCHELQHGSEDVMNR